MADTTTSNMIVAISIVALLVFISAVRKVLRRGEWSRTATLATAIVICTHGSVDVAVTYLGRWQKVTNVYLNMPWEWPGPAHQAWRALSLALGVIASAVFLKRAKRPDVVLNTPAVLIFLVGLISFGSSLLHGDNPFRPVSVVYVVLMAACIVAPRGLGIHVGVAACCMIVALASGFTFVDFVAHNGFGVSPCTPEKCGILNFDFSGVMENENGLALYLALAMPFVYIAFGSWEGLALCAYLLGLILITGSRSGASAGLITFLALVLLRPNVRRPTVAPKRSRLLYLGLASAFTVGIILPFTQQDPTAFTGRAHLWSLARQALSDPADFWYGTGVRGVQHLRDEGAILFPVYSVHNQWMQILLSSGVIGLIVFLTALVLLLYNARGAHTLVAGSVLVPAFVLAVTERPWPIDSLDWLTWVIPATLLSYPVIRREQDPADGARVPTASSQATLKRPHNAMAVRSDS